MGPFYQKYFRSIQTLALILIVNFLYGQDLHYTQFYNAHVNINPGLTGIFNGDVRFAGNYRNQWRALPIPYTTVTGAYDMKIYRNPTRKDFFGGGLVFNYDQAGDSKLSLATLGLNGSYSIPIGINYLTFGAQLGFSRRAFSLDDLTFDEQWNGIQFTPSKTITESFDRKSLFVPDLSMGINYRIQKKESRSKADFGIAAFHVNNPRNPFYSDDKSVKLPIRMAINGLVQQKLTESLDLMVNGIYQFQKPYHELVISAGPKFYLNQKKGKNYAVGIYGTYRMKDAIAPAFHLYMNDLQLGVSYDVNTSAFRAVTDHKGGPEFSLIYIISHVKPLSQFKACPIF